MAKPTLPQGTRDFSPDIVARRNYILQVIRNVFELYGFQPLETPAMENLETLMGKYGEEGDKLIFRILNNGLGDSRKIEASRAAFENVLAGRNDVNITERALRYDLTIPFARYLAMNHHQLALPFKRYQVQPVWRADRPQKGRYREFYQCDADVAGSDALLNEVEFALIYHEVFTRLGLSEYSLRINSRKLLSALAEKCGGHDKMQHITVAIDKLDKIGPDGVKQELGGRGLSAAQVEIIAGYLDIGGTNEEKLGAARQLLGEYPAGQEGVRELEYITRRAGSLCPGLRISVDFTLARGLDYYTGAIFEAKAPENVKMGSIGGGGRYDDLTGLFGVPGIPGAGISFGVDRIYDVLEELDLFPPSVNITTQALFLNLGEAEADAALPLLQSLRQKGVRAELFHKPVKIDRQFKYAEKKSIPFVITLGAEELKNNLCRVKDIRSGTQHPVALDELAGFDFGG